MMVSGSIVSLYSFTIFRSWSRDSLKVLRHLLGWVRTKPSWLIVYAPFVHCMHIVCSNPATLLAALIVNGADFAILIVGTPRSALHPAAFKVHLEIAQAALPLFLKKCVDEATSCRDFDQAITLFLSGASAAARASSSLHLAEALTLKSSN